MADFGGKKIRWVDMTSDAMVFCSQNHLVKCPNCGKTWPVSTEGKKLVPAERLYCDPNRKDIYGVFGCGIYIDQYWEK